MTETYHLSSMQGIAGRYSIALGLVCLALGTTGCDKSNTERGTIPATSSSEESPSRPTRPTRGEISCHLHSCAPPRYCNRDKGICELLPCTDSADCPYGYRCDFSKSVCQ